MSFKPSDSNTLLESLFVDLIKTLKRRNVKTPEITIAEIEEHLQLIGLITSKTNAKRKRGKELKKPSKKRIKQACAKGEVVQPLEKDPSSCVVA